MACERKIPNNPAKGKTVAVVVVVPGVDGGAAEIEGAGARTGGGTTRPVEADGMAVVEVTGVPVEGPAPEEGERYIFYQSS